MARRLVVIALSEASPRLIDAFRASGKMPRLQVLCEGGVTGRTRYGAPYLLTPQMWASVLTGRNAGSHGVFDYWQRADDGTFREMHGADIRGVRLCDAFDRLGVASAFVNVPMTYPPPETKGFAISGQDAPGAHASIAFPPQLYSEMAKRFGRYHFKDIFPGFESKAAYAGTIPREVSRQGPLFEWLVRRNDWKFLILYSSGTAFAQHYFWSDMDDAGSALNPTVENTFVAADRLIGQVADALDADDMLMVMSECGAGPIAGGVRLNTWLEAEGFLARRRATASALARLLTTVRRLAPRYLPKWAHHLVNRPLLKGLIQGRIAQDGVDWSRTKAFHRGKGEGNIYVNVAGRPGGIVGPSDYETVRSEIIARLTPLRDPATGKRAITAIHRREALYSGDQLAGAPDLVVEWADFRYMPCEGVEGDGRLFGPRTREYMTWPTSGSHRREGFLMAHGRGVRKGVLDEPFDLMDLAPTWMALLGQTPPDAMEGRSRRDDLVTAE